MSLFMEVWLRCSLQLFLGGSRCVHILFLELLLILMSVPLLGSTLCPALSV